MASAESSRPGAGYPTGVEKPADYATITGTGGGMAAKPCYAKHDI